MTGHGPSSSVPSLRHEGHEGPPRARGGPAERYGHARHYAGHDVTPATAGRRREATALRSPRGDYRQWVSGWSLRSTWGRSLCRVVKKPDDLWRRAVRGRNASYPIGTSAAESAVSHISAADETCGNAQADRRGSRHAHAAHPPPHHGRLGPLLDRHPSGVNRCRLPSSPAAAPPPSSFVIYRAFGRRFPSPSNVASREVSVRPSRMCPDRRRADTRQARQPPCGRRCAPRLDGVERRRTIAERDGRMFRQVRASGRYCFCAG
jgi:hypothetical protein